MTSQDAEPLGWPAVETGGAPPDPSDPEVEEGTQLARPSEVIAHGTVDGIPWTVEAWVTEPAPGARWWDVMVAVGLQMTFMLGHQGFLGGGGFSVVIPEGHHLTLGGHLFGRIPNIAVWCGCVSDEVASLEVRLSDGRVESTEPQRTLEGFPRFFVFFLPGAVPAELIVSGPDGSSLERHDLPQHDVPPDANAGVAVISAGWRADGPPPGWPEDDRTFAPDEGPRREEDFLLHIAGFPIYVISPEFWDGVVGLSGHSGRGSNAAYEVDQIRFYYLDRIGEPSRGLEIANVSSAEEARLEGLYRPHREEGIWWLDDHGDSAMSPELPGRFQRRDDSPDRDWRIPRARQFRGAGEVAVEGTSRPFERWAYLDYPDLKELRIRLPDVVVRIEGWDVTDDDLRLAAGRLERMTPGSDLLRMMRTADAATSAAWETLWGETDEEG
jgi:hypothetical protein